MYGSYNVQKQASFFQRGQFNLGEQIIHSVRIRFECLSVTRTGPRGRQMAGASAQHVRYDQFPALIV